MFLRLVVLLCALVLLSSCAVPPDSPRFQPSGNLPRHDQASFDQYVRDTRAWIADNRAFIGEDRYREIALNAPFERRPGTPTNRGILFVHGLGSSPWYFTDVANAMAEDGWLVRSILLPGHGTRPADLMLPGHDDWENAVAHHTKLLADDVDELWLSGFSTGGNLVTTQAFQDDSVDGLLLFSPAFTRTASIFFSPQPFPIFGTGSISMTRTISSRISRCRRAGPRSIIARSVPCKKTSTPTALISPC